MPKDPKTLPKRFQDEFERKRFAADRCREIQAWKDSLGDLPERWERNEQIYENDPSVVQVNVTEAQEAVPMPLWTQRADNIVGACMSGVTGIQPYVQCIADEPEREHDADAVEQDLHFLAIKSGFDLALEDALRIAVNTNLAHTKTTFDPDRVLFDFEVAHPLDTVLYPHEITDLQQLRMIGHSVVRLRMDVEADIENGRYLEAKLVAGDEQVTSRGGRNEHWDRTEGSYSDSSDTDKMTLYHLLSREIEDREDEETGETVKRSVYYRSCVAFDSEELLDIEEMPYEMFNYQDYRFSRKHNTYLPSGSPAQNAQGPQILYTRLINTTIQGAEMAAAPPIVVSGGTLTDTKLSTYGAGTVFEVPSTVQAQQLPISFNGEYLVNMIPLMERIMDGATGQSQVGTGQEAQGDKTATEMRAIMQGQAKGEARYLNSIARCVERQWAILFELYKEHYDELKMRWGGALQCDSLDMLLGLSLRFECAGRTGANDPASLVQKLQMLLVMADHPASTLDRMKVEDQIIQSMQLPFSVSKLLKENNFLARVQAFVQDSLEEGVPPQQILMGTEMVVGQAVMEAQAQAQEQQMQQAEQMRAQEERELKLATPVEPKKPA